MVSFITTPKTRVMFNSHTPGYLSSSSFPSIVLVVSPQCPKHQRVQELKRRQNCPFLNQFFVRISSDTLARRCKRWDGEGDLGLEAEIFEFMKKSREPGKFPSKRDLIEAGRMDLVKAIVSRGGWMSIGWDLDYQNEIAQKFDVMSTSREMALSERQENDARSEETGIDSERIEKFSISEDSSPAASSPGETVTEESGIHGILNRLERQRNSSLGLNLVRDDNNNRDSISAEDESNLGGIDDADSCYFDKNHQWTSVNPERSYFSDLKTSSQMSYSTSNGISSSLKPDAWRTWSLQRAGLTDIDFEAAEIDFNKSRKGTVDEKFAISIAEFDKESSGKSLESNSPSKIFNSQEIKSRLQDLELELSSALHLLRSNSSNLSRQDHVHLADDLRKLSDTWEFQETEMMNANDKLRSIRAKLAVLEGKMALSITDAQKIVNRKQRRIEDARRALQLLRSTCVVWSNPASEVLLAGSFDGWTAQWRMERSSTGAFSVGLKLYPGKYEIKFIVDGVWKVDPLRPIVHNEGYENNVLIIH